jgi:hypothetical protein
MLSKIHSIASLLHARKDKFVISRLYHISGQLGDTDLNEPPKVCINLRTTVHQKSDILGPLYLICETLETLSSISRRTAACEIRLHQLRGHQSPVRLCLSSGRVEPSRPKSEQRPGSYRHPFPQHIVGKKPSIAFPCLHNCLGLQNDISKKVQLCKTKAKF